MYIDHTGVQVLTHGTTWDQIDFGKPSRQPGDIGFCEICKTYIKHSALDRHIQDKHSVAKIEPGETEICLNLLNGTIEVEEERLKRVTPTDFDRAYIKQLYERRANLEASMAAA